MIEKIILSSLIENEDYMRKVIPYLKEEYFQIRAEKSVFNCIAEFVEKYNKLPTKEIIYVELDKRNYLEPEFDQITELLDSLEYEKKDEQWLLDETERFCQDQAIFNAVTDSIHIIEGKDKKQDRGSIPELLSTALGVSFDTSIGHNYFEDMEARYLSYVAQEERIPFDIEMLNKITRGGLIKKTLNILLGGVNVGKTMGMCSFAAANLLGGYNVLYITLEMAEEKISERIDANLLNIRLDDLPNTPKEKFMEKIAKLRKKTVGNLIVKEYPTATASVTNFRHLINELRIKKNYVPDIIYIDYLNLCLSSRIRLGGSVNSYTYVKSIAEEIRGLAVELKVPIVSATQLNRTGFTSSDPGMEDTSESFGVPAVADLMLAMVTTDELIKMDQIMFKQIKNRYSNKTKDERFVVGVDYEMMRLYNTDPSMLSSPTPVKDDGPVFDNTPFGKGVKRDFSGLFN